MGVLISGVLNKKRDSKKSLFFIFLLCFVYSVVKGDAGNPSTL